MPKAQIFNVANMSFKAIRENKILTKISEFTVPVFSVQFIKGHRLQFSYNILH